MDADVDDGMEIENPHVLVEMTDEPDCRFVADWLVKAAEAQTAWSKAFDDPLFEERTALLHVESIPDLAASALQMLGKLEHQCGVAVLDLYSGGDTFVGREFAFLVRLGFFVHVDGRYRMAVPELITLEKVKQAALDVQATVEDEDGLEIIQPERLLHTLTKAEAEAERSVMLAMRRFRMITSFAHEFAGPDKQF
jgi:hypothetical protein